MAWKLNVKRSLSIIGIFVFIILSASLFSTEAKASVPKGMYSEDILSQSEDYEYIRTLEPEMTQEVLYQFNMYSLNFPDEKVEYEYDRAVRIYARYTPFEGQYVSKERLEEIAFYSRQNYYWWEIPVDYPAKKDDDVFVRVLCSVDEEGQKTYSVFASAYDKSYNKKTLFTYADEVKNELPEDATIRFFDMLSKGNSAQLYPVGVVISDNQISGLLAATDYTFLNERLEEAKKNTDEGNRYNAFNNKLEPGKLYDYSPLYALIEEERTDPVYHWQELNSWNVAPMKDDPDVNYLPGILLAVLLAGGIVVIVILKKRFFEENENI